ncbi:hypothetical protein N0V88_005067 [Collariella sp. IMI 366227]|nr:hypothetical protein N0V88_005067 [Collariella sp. IMI 366227]
MASASKDQAAGERRSDTIGGFSPPERQSSIPIPPTPNPPSSPGNAPPSAPQPGPQPVPQPGSQPTPADQPNPAPPSVSHRFLTPEEWARVAHGIGAIKDGEQHQVVHPTSWYWPPKGLPGGLYRDVIKQRTKYSISFRLITAIHWFLMVLQVIIGAILTALGAIQLRVATPITILAAINTFDAGLLAMMHNSGLPDRYRMDMAQFVQLEDFLNELLDTGVVETQKSVEDILADCYDRFHAARTTVLANKPDVYTTPQGSGADKILTVRARPDQRG